MKENLTATIYAAIENRTPIRFTFESGTNAISTSLIPDGVDEGSETLIVYSGTDIITIGTKFVEYNEVENEYMCANGFSFVTISEDQ